MADFPEQGSRELHAGDYAYQIKRLADPRLHSPIHGLMRQYIVGFSELAEALDKQTDGDRWVDLRTYPLPGVEVVDERTFRVTLKGKYPQFTYWLAMPFFAPVPWEVDAFYRQPGMRERNLTLDGWPVGTGPFMMTAFEPMRQIRLSRNPYFHGEDYPIAGEPADTATGLLHDAGKPIPFLDGALYTLEKESIPLWNKFLQGYYDLSRIGSDNFDQAIQVKPDGGPEPSEAMRAQGIRLATQVAPTTWYLGFNMLDPVVGSLNERGRKLRQAVSVALDMEEYLAIFMNGRGIPAQGPIPPGIPGYRDGRDGMNASVYEWDATRLKPEPRPRKIEDARGLLAEAGYPGGRNAATGKPLVLYLDIAARGPDDKARLDWFRKCLKQLGIELIVRNTDYNRFQEKMLDGHAQLFEWAWNADYPDAENFLFLFYGPNGKVPSGGENNSNYRNPAFDDLFEQMKGMGDGPSRRAIVDDMVRILRHDAPWVFGYHPSKYALHHTWLANDKPNPMALNTLKYLRIDPASRERSRAAWNRPDWQVPLMLAILPLAAFMPVWISHRRRRAA